MWEVERCRVEIAGLISTHSMGSGTQLLQKGWIHHYSEIAQGGWFRLTCSSLSWHHVLEFTPVNKRIFSLCLWVSCCCLCLRAE